MNEYELYHHGVKGQKWGVRRDKYLAKMARNQAKINVLDKKLHTTGALKRKQKAAKAQAKLDKVERKATKARRRLAAGKHLSKGQTKAIMRAEKYRAKVARNSAKNDKWETGIAKLERKNAKLQKRVDRLNKKIIKEQINSPENQQRVAAGKNALQNNPKIHSVMDQKASALDRAKNQGMYSLDFLEATQNKNLSNKRMVSEYSKYLDDPHKYRSETVHRLKDY